MIEVDEPSTSVLSGVASLSVGDKDTRIRDHVLDVWTGGPALVFGTWRIPRPAGEVHRAGNAEDCPVCATGIPSAYPWVCDGGTP